MRSPAKFTMRQVEEYWDSAAAFYDSANKDVADIHNQRFVESVKLLRLKRQTKILNIWSRTAGAIPFLREREVCLDITNAELSGEMIKRAKANFAEEKFDKVDLLNLPYPDDYFDEVLSLETIEHVNRPDIFLKELYRVLLPQGRLVLSTPSDTAELTLMISGFFFKHHGEGPHRFLNSTDMKQLIKDAVFKLVKHKPTLLFPVGIKCIRDFGEKVIGALQNTFVSEWGIRHFYVAEK